jgi:hypothetical protein
MDDILYLTIVAIFFAATLGLMKLCDVLGKPQSGDRA